MSSSIKAGVRFATPVDAMCEASAIVREVFAEYKEDCVLTCGIEKHEPPSWHVLGGAKDWRLNHMTRSKAETITNEVRNRVNEAFDVLDHGDDDEYHLHVEYEPKAKKRG